MNSFIKKYSDLVIGKLSGFDRIIFRGTLRQLAYLEGMHKYLSMSGVLLKDFSKHVQEVTNQIRNACRQFVQSIGCREQYLESNNVSKEKIAHQIAKEENIKEGLICLLSSVEPCYSYDVRRDRKLKKLVLESRIRKCLHFYLYSIDPVFGFMHARLQTWFPFSIQVYINGREWLARQMDKHGLSYQRRDNCFIGISDFAQAQELLDQQLDVCWPVILNKISRQLNPIHDQIFDKFKADYYWSVGQSEWASDIVFKSSNDLSKIYPNLFHHAITSFDSKDVLRFLGRKIPAHEHAHGAFLGEVVSDIKHRPEGIRVKHRVKKNSIKMYDKQGSVLRIETTINDPRDFKVFRRPMGNQDKAPDWLVLRKGVADIKRRATVSNNANNRYFSSLTLADDITPLSEIASNICKFTMWKGKRVRALNPWSQDDMELLKAVNNGEYLLNGFRNRDLCAVLFPPTESSEIKRKYSAAITRKLRLLRAHGLIRKVEKTHRYLLTIKGQKAIAALIAAYNADANKLVQTAG